MPISITSKRGQKRTRNGTSKPSTQPPPKTPPSAQPPKDSSTTLLSTTTTTTSVPEQQVPQQHPQSKSKPQPSHPHPRTHKKIPRLPPNTSIHTRPLPHPAPPNLHTSSSSPKTVYIRASTPFIPTIKRIRSLLKEVEKRNTQSENAGNQRYGGRQGLRADGGLTCEGVERAIAEGGINGEGGKERECVYVKATGRAISRALEVGCYFQGEVGMKVTVKTGSVRVVDDVEVKEEGDAGGGEDTEMVDVEADEEGGGGESGKSKKKRRRGKVLSLDDVPETRIRTVSSVTVEICMV
ncbi:hypothetical protein M011DRAFT_523021 [Sporormia fimetaria CBS 119925]|uniref:Uncharacterized protein n=1 Tax=Sporormia fimetaria CBS 119925 TaxID=1340428 RepID=A0A6A6VNI5_9PLEO|nr:hypothetical protein M011DRAFT_523021 [Sporormia fimetaria CBS 119925]